MMTPKEMLDLADAGAQMVELITGMKAQYIAAGWSEEAAETLVVAMMVNANGTTDEE